ncbi:hypothetical protein RJ640_022161 [Escallonia rubra]|uniref:Uncharacterized protein n=1 Tax=Escallonia rubra TaxID=112253 RepID=A0AA88U6L6_9ASTE|nr:hypothetical protein RJ640_022161 [Escallonia rubra]
MDAPIISGHGTLPLATTTFTLEAGESASIPSQPPHGPVSSGLAPSAPTTPPEGSPASPAIVARDPQNAAPHSPCRRQP